MTINHDEPIDGAIDIRDDFERGYDLGYSYAIEDERERIMKALKAEYDGERVAGEEYIDAIDRAIAIVRGDV